MEAVVVHCERGGVEIIDRLGDEWREVCMDGPNDEPFYRPEWVSAYVRAFEPTADLLVISARTAGRLAAVLPLFADRANFIGFPIIRRLRGPANINSVRFDLSRRSGPEGDAAVNAIWQRLRSLPGWDVIIFPRMRADSAAAGLVAEARAEGFPTMSRTMLLGPLLSLDDWDVNKDLTPPSTRPSMRKYVGRIIRKAQAEGELQLRRVETAAAADLQRFYDLENAGWKGKQGTAIACDPRTRQFFDEAARGAAQFGYLSLYFLELDGRLLAAHFGLSYRARYYMAKVAMDEQARRLAPGHLIVRAVMHDCAARGLDEFDFLGTSDDWKLRWTSSVRPRAEWYIFRKGVWRTLYAARFQILEVLGRISQIKQRIPPPIKHIIKKLIRRPPGKTPATGEAQVLEPNGPTTS